MRGNIQKINRKKGTVWKACIDVPATKTNKRRQKTKSFRTKREAEKWLTKKSHELYSGTYIEPSEMLLKDWLKEWLETFSKPNVRKTTHVTYAYYMDKYVIPIIGDFSLKNLKTPLIQQLYNSLELAPASVRKIHMILRQALDQAVILGYMRLNPADGKRVSIPKTSVQDQDIHYWTTEQTHKFIKACKEHTNPIYSTIFYVALMTGLRRGEILGLRWQDIDFIQSHISVRQSITFDMNGDAHKNSPKTKSGERTVFLDHATLTRLKRHQDYMKALKLNLGEAFQKTDLVFTTTTGTLIDTSNLRRSFNNVIKHADVPKIRFHDLRHTHASLLLNAGVNPKIVQERLGHTSIQITMDIYSHLMPHMQEEAITQFSDDFHRKVNMQLVSADGVGHE